VGNALVPLSTAVEATETVWLGTLLRSVVASNSAIAAAVRWLVAATDRMVLAISRVAAPYRLEAVIGEPKLSGNRLRNEEPALSELSQIKKGRPLYGNNGEPCPEGPRCYAYYALAFWPSLSQRFECCFGT
jgi:hypothetical protein